MVTFFESNWYWKGGFTEDEQKYYKQYRLSEKGKYVWKQIDRLKFVAGNLCSKYDVSWCFNESGCFKAANHFPFQCTCNDNEILSSYDKGAVLWEILLPWCFNESGCFKAANHFPFQCTCNYNEMLSSYARGIGRAHV